MPPVQFRKLSPVLIGDAIEPCLPFWMERLGFAKVVEVPEGDRLGFVILTKDGVEVMYQSRESVRKDIAAVERVVGGWKSWCPGGRRFMARTRSASGSPAAMWCYSRSRRRRTGAREPRGRVRTRGE